MLYYGAQHDLEQLIETHLFVISPNNSGSTFVKNVLGTSPGARSLLREGQHLFGFPGPTPLKLNLPYLWAAEQLHLDVLSDPVAYNWEMARKVWYFQAFSRSPRATVLVEKSPPFLLHVKALSQHFRNAKFLFMVRDPYAVAEGVLRAAGLSMYPSREVATRLAALHVAKSMQIQRRNLTCFGDLGLFFTYETMCAEPLRLQRKILDFVPELGELTLQQRVAVKGNYDEPLRNMNSQQIERLSVEDLESLNAVYSRHQDVFEFFGYSIRDSKPSP